MTSAVWPRMYLGVPKKRAATSARRPKASSPKALGRSGISWEFGHSAAVPARPLGAARQELTLLLALAISSILATDNR
jgi:hypothetical protein